MDDQIRKVRKDVVRGDKKGARKDIRILLKMDKKFDKKLASCDKQKASGKK
jgi:hypothetical protein